MMVLLVVWICSVDVLVVSAIGNITVVWIAVAVNEVDGDDDVAPVVFTAADSVVVGIAVVVNLVSGYDDVVTVAFTVVVVVNEFVREEEVVPVTSSAIGIFVGVAIIDVEFVSVGKTVF